MAELVGLEFLLQRARDRQAALRRRREEVRSNLPSCVSLLVTRYRATRVVLFGSFAHSGTHEESDVDLGVLGVSERDHLKAAADAEKLLGATVDLIRLEDAPQTLRDRLVDEGVVLYGA